MLANINEHSTQSEIHFMIAYKKNHLPYALPYCTNPPLKELDGLCI